MAMGNDQEQFELIATTLSSRSSNSKQENLDENVEVINNLPCKFDALYLNFNREETLDSRDEITKEANSTGRNRRTVDIVTNETDCLQLNVINNIAAKLGPIVGYADEPLLTLTEACAPLITTIDNLSIYVQQALKETLRPPPDGLTVDESAAIRLYTLEWKGKHRSLYDKLNHTLKQETRDHLRPYFRYLKLLLTALVKVPCLPQHVIWRGVTKDLSGQFPPGTPVIWWGFSSCTISLPVLENKMYLGDVGKRTLFSVETINSRDIRAHSHFVNEDEVLLLPATQMIVQSQFSPAPDLHIIHLKQIIPEKVLLELPFEGAHLYPETRRVWYRKKRLIVPICLLTILLITAIILGSVLGTRFKKSVCKRPFQASKTYNVGNQPSSSVLGHFRNSREMDVAVTNQQDDSVTILYGDENGNFQYPGVYTVGKGPWSVLSNDFNNDKKLDLVVVNSWNETISVLFGKGNGLFEAAQTFLVGRGPSSATLADFDNDGKLDLAVTNGADNTVSVLLGNTQGVFQIPTNYKVGQNPASIIAADFNNDNKSDLAVANLDGNSISLLLNSGNGTFYTIGNYTVPKGPFSIIAVDFDNDDRMDLAVANLNNNMVSVLLGNGNGTFQTPRTYKVGQNPWCVTSVDLNNDRNMDLVVANQRSNTISVLLGNGNGTFRAPTNYSSQYPFYVISADFNNDKKLDLIVVQYSTSSILVLLGTGKGTFTTRNIYHVGRFPAAVTAADFDNDHQLDLAVVNRDLQNGHGHGHGNGHGHA